MIKSFYQKHFEPETFNLKILSFMIYLWGVLNLFNGIIIFNHDVDPLYIGTNYYYVIGTVRILIGIVTLILAWYIWIFSSDIVIFRRSDEKKTETPEHGEEILTVREGGKLHFKE